MNNADMPAMPRAEAKSHIDTVAKDALGLTKREDFAKAAMQGLLSDHNVRGSAEDIAKTSVELAEALLTALERTS